LVNRTNIDLIYDPDLVRSIPVFVDIQNGTATEILRAILRGTPFDFIILSSGTYVITERKTIAARYGRFFGYVLDAETGTPISNATILLADASNSTFTNPNGFFSVSPLLAGDYPVVFSSLGYQSQSATIKIEENSTSQVIRLTPKPFQADPIVIEATPSLGLNQLAQGVPISGSDQIQRLASESAIQGTSFFSGIIFNQSQQTLSIQGGDPGNYLMMLDGVPMYASGTLGASISAFSPYAIDEVSIQKAGYDATHSDALDGLIQFRQHAPKGEQQTALVSAQPNSLNGQFSTALPGGWRSTATLRVNQPGRNMPLGFRDQLQDWNRLDPLLQNFLMGENGDIAHYNQAKQEQEFGFFDGHFTFEKTSADLDRTIISGYIGSQSFTSQLLSERLTIASVQPGFVYSREDIEQQTAMAQVTHFQVLSAKADAHIQGYVSFSSSDNQYFMQGNDSLHQAGHSSRQAFDFYQQQYRPDNTLIDQQETREAGVKSSLTYFMDARTKITTGLDLQYIDYLFGLNDLFYFPTQNQSSVLLSSLYTQSQFTLSKHVRFSAGFRSTFSSENQQAYVQPRFNLTIDTDRTLLGYHTFSISGGVYRQFIHQFDVTNIGPSAFRPFHRFILPVDASIPVPVSYHLAGGWTASPSEQTRFETEVYYKWEPQSYEMNIQQLLAEPTQASTALQDQSQFLTEAETYSVGGAFSITHTFNEPQIKLRWLNQVSISRRRNDARFNGNWTHTFWSEPFSTAAFLDWNISKRVSFLANARWTPVRFWAFNHAYYDFLTTHGTTEIAGFDFNSPDSQRLDPFFRADIGVTYRIPIRNSNLKTRIDLLNITNRLNETQRLLNPISSSGNTEYEVISRRLPGFIPSLSLQFEF
ncbi:MAG: TonB-dependent receptor, partial [Bacteroidota bacterium]